MTYPLFVQVICFPSLLLFSAWNALSPKWFCNLSLSHLLFNYSVEISHLSCLVFPFSLSLLGGLLGFVSLPLAFFLSFSAWCSWVFLLLCFAVVYFLFEFSSHNLQSALCFYCCGVFCTSVCVCVCVCVCLFSFSVLAHEWVELCVVVVLLGCLGILSVPLLVCYAVCVGLVEVFLLCVALLTAGVFFFFFFVWLRWTQYYYYNNKKLWEEEENGCCNGEVRQNSASHLLHTRASNPRAASAFFFNGAYTSSR